MTRWIDMEKRVSSLYKYCDRELTPLAAGDLIAGRTYWVSKDGDRFVVQIPDEDVESSPDRQILNRPVVRP